MIQKKTELIQTQKGETLQYFQEGEHEFLQTQAGVRYPVDGNIIYFLDHISLTRNNEKYQKMYDRFSRFHDFPVTVKRQTGTPIYPQQNRTCSFQLRQCDKFQFEKIPVRQIDATIGLC